MKEETKKKISDALKAKGIKPKVIFNWTGLKHSKPSPRKGEKRPEWIGKKISDAKKGHSVSQETRDKISKTLEGKFTGENSPNWIKDRTQIRGRHERTYHDSDYKIWRGRVYSRDGFKCRVNNKQCKGRIEAHHILAWRDYPELRYKTNNGITLCHAHHPIKRAEEKRLIPYFKKLLRT